MDPSQQPFMWNWVFVRDISTRPESLCLFVVPVYELNDCSPPENKDEFCRELLLGSILLIHAMVVTDEFNAQLGYVMVMELNIGSPLAVPLHLTDHSDRLIQVCPTTH